MCAIKGCYHRVTNIFRVDMNDPASMFLDDTQVIATGKTHVSGVIKQPDRVAGAAHQKIEIFLGLDPGAHMMVESEWHAHFCAIFRKARQAMAIGADLILIKRRRVSSGGVRMFWIVPAVSP